MAPTALSKNGADRDHLPPRMARTSQTSTAVYLRVRRLSDLRWTGSDRSDGKRRQDLGTGHVQRNFVYAERSIGEARAQDHSDICRRRRVSIVGHVYRWPVARLTSHYRAMRPLLRYVALCDQPNVFLRSSAP